MSDTVSRPNKMTDASTVLYEIDMFRFAAHRLFEGQWQADKDQWVYLESFLLHYRNLIEFLGKQENISETDLHISNLWERLGIKEPATVDRIKEGGEKLWDKYERGADRISRYLHHCTSYRTDFKQWDVGGMSAELETVIVDVEKALPDQRSWEPERPISSPEFWLGSPVSYVGPKRKRNGNDDKK